MINESAKDDPGAILGARGADTNPESPFLHLNLRLRFRIIICLAGIVCTCSETSSRPASTMGSLQHTHIGIWSNPRISSLTSAFGYCSDKVRFLFVFLPLAIGLPLPLVGGPLSLFAPLLAPSSEALRFSELEP